MRLPVKRISANQKRRTAGGNNAPVFSRLFLGFHRHRRRYSRRGFLLNDEIDEAARKDSRTKSARREIRVSSEKMNALEIGPGHQARFAAGVGEKLI
jgi:hypothetical protein